MDLLRSRRAQDVALTLLAGLVAFGIGFGSALASVASYRVSSFEGRRPAA